MDLQRTIWIAEVCIQAILLAVLIVRGLASKYPAFTSYVAFDVISSVGLMFAGDPAHSRTYLIAWMVTSVLTVFLQTAAVLELFRHICDHYAGIGKFGRTLVLVLVFVAALLALTTVFPELGSVEWRRSLLQMVVLFRRLTSTAFAFFLVAAALFFVRFPTPFRRNVVIHGRLLAVYFVVNACSDMAFILKGIGSARALSEILFSARAVCFLAWTFLLTKSGEVVPERPHVSDEDYQRVERWNRELLQAGRWLVG